MSLVRPLEAADLPEITRLYRRVFGNRRRPDAELSDELRRFYLDGPFRETDIPSLVHADDAGRPTGFIGVHTVPFRIEGRRVRAAFCGALLSADQSGDPLAGARLLKAFLAGPQDLSMSETANAVSQGMWERLRGTVLAPYSLEWVRVLRPGGFVLAYAAQRIPPLAALGGLAPSRPRAETRPGRAASTLLRFVAPPGAAPLAVQDLDREGFATLVRQFSEGRGATPDWERGYLEHVLGTGLDKPEFGTPVMAALRTRGGEPIGAFLYHLRPHGIGRVLQMVFKPGRAGTVLDHLFADALQRGAAGLRGRTEPAILEAAPGRHMLCVAASSTVLHTKDASLAAPFLAGDCLLNGLAGERWSRFFGAGFS